MDIDIVYTWVNASDEDWQRTRREFVARETGKNLEYRAGASRFRDNNELKYAIRSIERYAPFIRKIFIVHAGKAPQWLKKDRPDLVFIPQEDILPAHCLVSYQSDVIEAFLYKIPDLSEHYIYANDDNFFCTPHSKTDLFDEKGRAKVSITWRLAGQGVDGVYRQMELNAGRALMKHLKNIPEPVIMTYKWLPLMARRLLKGCLPFNTATHVAQPFRKSIWQDFHNVFAAEIEMLCRGKFRSEHGFTVNFAAHHYARSLDKAIFELSSVNEYLGRNSSTEQREIFQKELFENAENIKRFCLNDEPADENDGWYDYANETLNKIFPEPSRFEIAQKTPPKLIDGDF